MQHCNSVSTFPYWNKHHQIISNLWHDIIVIIVFPWLSVLLFERTCRISHLLWVRCASWTEIIYCNDIETYIYPVFKLKYMIDWLIIYERKDNIKCVTWYHCDNCVSVLLSFMKGNVTAILVFPLLWVLLSLMKGNTIAILAFPWLWVLLSFMKGKKILNVWHDIIAIIVLLSFMKGKAFLSKKHNLCVAGCRYPTFCHRPPLHQPEL